MNYNHFTILFVIIFFTFGLRACFVVASYEAAADNYTRMERAFFDAADAAGEVLCRYGGSGIQTDKSAAYDAFVRSMYASLGILDEPAKREAFLNYIPLFVVLENDAFYVYFEGEYQKADGYHYQTRNWSEGIPYSYSDEDFAYRFSLDGTVSFYDKNGLLGTENRLYKATQEELGRGPQYETLRLSRPDSFLFNEDMYQTVRQTAVITAVQDAMRYYVNTYNRIANDRGIAYEFALPVIDNSVWARSIEHPGVLAMIQGYPISTTNHIYYSQYAFVGAQIYKSEPYYVTNWGWHASYHRRNCEKLAYADETILFNPYYSVEECVKLGAYACELCIPDGVYPPEDIYPLWTWE